MAFLDSLGEFMGKLAAQGQEIQSLKSDYENMSDTELKREYTALKGKSGNESRNRFTAVRSILIDRGIIKQNND